jgi:hypothetical protein
MPSLPVQNPNLKPHRAETVKLTHLTRNRSDNKIWGEEYIDLNTKKLKLVTMPGYTRA